MLLCRIHVTPLGSQLLDLTVMDDPEEGMHLSLEHIYPAEVAYRPHAARDDTAANSRHSCLAAQPKEVMPRYARTPQVHRAARRPLRAMAYQTGLVPRQCSGSAWRMLRR